MTQSNRHTLISAAFAALRHLLPAFALLCSVSAGAQGWEKVFGGNKEDQGLAVIQTSDLGYLVIGYSESFPSFQDQDIDVYAIKTDVDGTLVWEETFDDGYTEYANAVLQASDNSYLIAGEISYQSNTGPFEAYLLKINEQGKKEWHRSYSEPTANSLRINDIVAAPDGGYLMVGMAVYDSPNSNEDIFLLKVDENGDEQWRKIFGTVRGEEAKAVIAYQGGYVICGTEDNPQPPPIAFGGDMVTYRLDAQGETIWKRVVSTLEEESGNDIVLTKDGNFVIAGFSGNNRDVALWKYDGDGNQLWETINDVFGEGDAANSIIELPDGSLVIAGLTEVSGINTDFLIGKYAADGSLMWFNHTGDVVNADEAQSIAPTFDGGYVITGSAGLFLTFVNDMVLTRTDGNGDIYTNYIKGKVFNDLNENCQLNSTEPPFAGWLVRARGEEATFFGSTGPSGNYIIRVDTGNYVVEAIPINTYWESCTPNGVNLTLTNFYDTTTVNFPIKATDMICPYMEVDVSTPFLAPCTEVVYTVSYANNGTADADNAFVDVTLDDELSLISASLPFTFDGEKYTFGLGDLSYNTSGSFTINTQMACDGIAMGQAGLVIAHIYPDSLCTAPDPNWDGASIIVEGQCVNDSLEFHIRNIGQEAMSESKNYFIVEEDVVVFLQSFQLNPDEEVPIKFKGDGATYRIVAEQSEGHPGNSYPTVAIEGCVEDGQPYSTGYLSQFPEDELNPFVSIQVNEVMEDMQEVALLRYPKGLRDSVIAADMDITYRYVFRNLGNDTISRVVIRDTLPAALDPGAVIPGASSHPYRLEVYHTGVLKITFDDIILPMDPSGNEPASYGFVEIKVGQKPGNELGTVVENQATVIFDYYPPIQTNKARHVIEVDSLEVLVEFLPTDVNNPATPKVNVKAYPNPFVEYVTLEVEGWPQGKNLVFTLFNANGQLIKYDEVQEGVYTFQRRALPAGAYFYSLKSEGKLVGSGSLIVR
ncbi:MAG: T9SS type A sorting domain-containing protein [Phaeodactylibacter sp.]|nr:T9SS type A sorting domain-containing protein [Phaeodactylibacter sp.]MCB9277184.1 T9SS type A sorting domain-containing protein [Lewinellaceae bacterium]